MGLRIFSIMSPRTGVVEQFLGAHTFNAIGIESDYASG